MDQPFDSSSLHEFFDSAYGGVPPWDIGGPQPDLIALLDEFPPASPALDVGCGTGDLSFALADRGCHVLGIDSAKVAIGRAQAKLRSAPRHIRQLVEFRLGDALAASKLRGPFRSVVDTGFIHLFAAPQREHFLRELISVLTPDARYYLLGFAVELPVPCPGHPFTESELMAHFTAERGWRKVTLRPARYVTHSPLGDIQAIAACFERTTLN